jgi:hypothetical protein
MTVMFIPVASLKNVTEGGEIRIGLIDLTPKDRFYIVAPQKIDYAMN